MKTLVVYFTQSRNTENAAKIIAKKTNADIVELKPKKPYPNNYDALTKVSKSEIDNEIHPEISNEIDFKEYDKIFLGFPTWYQRPPMIVDSFFEKFDLTGRKVIPFSTSASTQIDELMPYLNKMGKVEKGFTANSKQAIDSYFSE